MAISLQRDSAGVAVDDPEIARFLLSQPDLGAALRSSPRLGSESLRPGSEPRSDRDGFRNVGVVPDQRRACRFLPQSVGLPGGCPATGCLPPCATLGPAALQERSGGVGALR
ncbi:MAG TPA: hypothetical protein VH916_08265 [Dehalococcoidia bacterium]